MSTTTALAPLPTEGEWRTLKEVCAIATRSGFLPTAIKGAEQAITIALKGRELSIPPMQSFSHIHIIEGKPSCSAELMLAILARGGVTWEWERDGSDNDAAVIVFHRKGWKPARGSFTKADAQRIKKKTKDGWVSAWDTFTWKQYPQNMLRARAISNGARMIAPDLLAGMSYTPEELGADLDPDGRRIEPPSTIQVDRAVVDTATGEVLREEPVVEEARQLYPATEPEDATPENEGLIHQIETEEKALGMTPGHVGNARRKYLQQSDLSRAEPVALETYLHHLLDQRSTQASDEDTLREAVTAVLDDEVFADQERETGLQAVAHMNAKQLTGYLESLKEVQAKRSADGDTAQAA